jgi:hypothetical protein
VGDVTDRWVFGVDPLPQSLEVATLLRRITGLVLSLENEIAAVDQLVSDLRRAEVALAAAVPTDPTPRMGPTVAGDGRVYIDHAFAIGSYNACFPEYEIVVEDQDRAHGSVEFPVAYEGPPGLVHGGFLGLFFDCVTQHHNCEVGVAGKTTSLVVRYRRPTPLSTPLTFTLERSVSNDRIHTAGTLWAADTVVCEAEVSAIAGVRTNLPGVSARRERP